MILGCTCRRKKIGAVGSGATGMCNSCSPVNDGYGLIINHSYKGHNSNERRRLCFNLKYSTFQICLIRKDKDTGGLDQSVHMF